MVELVVTDLDGTLWDRHRHLHARTRGAIDELERCNIPVLAATSRNAGSTFHEFSRLHLTMPAVLCNGAIGKWPGGAVFHRRAFPQSAVLESITIFEATGIVPHVSIADALYSAVGPPNASSCETFRARAEPLTLEAGVATALSFDVLQFRVIGLPRERLLAAYEAFASCDGVRAYLTEDHQFGEWSLDIAPVGADKWTGVEAYCELHGIDSSAILGIGDGVNDAGFLSRSRVAVVMPHAAPELRALADHVLDEGAGWSGLLEFL
jgi:hydroxymethylpyrimidine pyrophosphatase-like HAD family hydrolase